MTTKEIEPATLIKQIEDALEERQKPDRRTKKLAAIPDGLSGERRRNDRRTKKMN